jgi:hypothetical protein
MKISKLSFVGIVLMLTLASFGVVSACSCTPGFWKAPQHLYAWKGIQPGDLSWVGGQHPSDLNGDGMADTYLDALSYKGGPGIQGAQRIFIRAWVANQLNVQYNDPGEFHDCDLVCQSTLGGTRAEIIEKAEALDIWNNFGICDVLEQNPLPK